MAEYAAQTTKKGSRLLDFALAQITKNLLLRRIRASSEQARIHIKIANFYQPYRIELRRRLLHLLSQIYYGLCPQMRDQIGLRNVERTYVLTTSTVYVYYKLRQ